jgi:hypothetical protein
MHLKKRKVSLFECFILEQRRVTLSLKKLMDTDSLRKNQFN